MKGIIQSYDVSIACKANKPEIHRLEKELRGIATIEMLDSFKKEAESMST